jgi:exo-beta-1,3-glucanase (GH17 family)
MTDSIRTFSVTHGFNAIPGLAEPFGMEVVPTAFLNNESNSWAPAANAEELNNLVALLTQGPANIPFGCVGSEAMETQGFTQQQLIEKIQYVKDRVPDDVLIATAEPWDHYLADPNGTTPNALGAAVDVIYANIHP